MDNASFALIPVANSNNIRIVVLDPDPAEELRAFDDKLWKFQNDFRPSKRYLYFAFDMALLRRQRHQLPGWWYNFEDYGLQDMWASPGAYLQTSTLTTMARRNAHMQPTELSALFKFYSGHAHAHPSRDIEERDVVVSDSASVSSNSLGKGKADFLPNTFSALDMNDDC